MQLQDKLRTGHTALIVIDIQNDFCSPNGIMAKMGKDVSSMPRLVQGIKTLAAACDSRNIPIFYTQQIYDRSKLNNLQKEQYDLDGKLITCDIDGDGWKFYGLTPPKSKVYPKYDYNIFSNEKLKHDLEQAGTKTLIVTGVATQVCVETAIRNGFDLGYKIVVPEELTATTSKDLRTKERTIHLVRKTYGVVCTMDEVIEAIQA